jgi:hypothetical protein
MNMRVSVPAVPARNHPPARPHAFAPGPAHPSVAPLFAGAALLDAEKLDVYRIALEFQAIAGQLVPKRGFAELRDQLDRASGCSRSWGARMAATSISQRE